MNQLSWVLYLADVLPSFATGVCVVCVVLTLAMFISSIVYFVAEEIPDEYRQRFRLSPYFFGFFLVLALLTSFVPGKNTFYLIAASQMGQQALQTPEVAKLRAVVDGWLEDHTPSTSKKKED